MIDIVIVNWNSGSQLFDCLESIVMASRKDFFLTGVIVVDNASSDNSLERLDSLNLPLRIIRNSVNRGFGAACNQGAALCETDYLLFLNPDTKLFDDSLTIPIAFMMNELNQDIGICGIQLYDKKGQVSRTCARFPSPTGFVAHAVGLDRFFPRLGHCMAEWDHASNRQVDQVIGAFFLVRHELFEALNGFDERFFVYFEEVDFSLRASQSGWKSIYLAGAQAFHAGGGTSNQIKARRLFYSLRSRLMYADKHFSLLGFLCVLMATLLIEPLTRSSLVLARHSWQGLKETWSAYAMLWSWLPQWLFRNNT